jgi:hypothetical protein
VVGTRGKSLGGFQGLLPGSVSKYCLQHSPVPVIVVRPTSKRDKAKGKRAQDPDRSKYKQMLQISEPLPDVNSPRNIFFANDEETLPRTASTGSKLAPEATHPLKQVAHADSSEDDLVTNSSTLVDDPRSPAQLMKSPNLQNLESPEFSDDPSSGDDDDEGGVSSKPPGSGASEIAQKRGGLEFEETDISPKAQQDANPLDTARTNSLASPDILITVTDPNDPSRVHKVSEGT